jgi:protein-tyrosine phosphatase
MIDLHCHILPGVDDGPPSLAESLEMCRMASDDGIRTVAAMPHTLNGVYVNEGPAILEAVASLNQAIRAAGIDLEVLPGADVHVDPELVALVRSGRVMTINDNRVAVMLEFPDHFVPEVMGQFLQTIIAEGILPVVSHPERCRQLHDRDILAELVKMGAVIQVTAMSLTGEFGHRVRSFTRKILASGLVHVIASDGHSIQYRPPVLSRALAEASHLIGADKAVDLVQANPRAILEGKRPA